MTFQYTQEATSIINAKADDLFDFLDDQASLGGHMEKPSAMMLGGSMHYAFDEGKGRAIGSVIHMDGKMLGLTLTLDEIVVEREPPRRKIWRTIAVPHILVVGHYRMGFEIEPDGIGSLLRVFIDYDLPASRLGRFLGLMFARPYARWCVRKMADDAAKHFNVSVGEIEDEKGQ
jgi:Polyketide cyclase / dehydrase and lipid transport